MTARVLGSCFPLRDVGWQAGGYEFVRPIQSVDHHLQIGMGVFVFGEPSKRGTHGTLKNRHIHISSYYDRPRGLGCRSASTPLVAAADSLHIGVSTLGTATNSLFGPPLSQMRGLLQALQFPCQRGFA